MFENKYVELFQQYVCGWKQNDIELIVGCLLEKCMIIESHGPTYHGHHDVRKWFTFWQEAKSTVLKWHILSCSVCVKEESAFFEWDFECISNDTLYALPGISRVRLAQHKISFIHVV